MKFKAVVMVGAGVLLLAAGSAWSQVDRPTNSQTPAYLAGFK